jgi:GDP-4-dehydro-6-deoxy-D-mannose reductase
MTSDPILITGAAGFVGSHLVEHLATSHAVVGWARSAPPREVASLARWQSVDLLQRDQVRRAIAELRPSVVYHCAGLPHVAESWHDTAQPLAINALGTHHLLDALSRAAVRARVLVVGSATVYARAAAPLREDAPLAPDSPYGRSKLAQEQLGLRAGIEDGLDVIVTRTFNHTGPRQTASFVAPSMARQIARIERGENEPIIRVGNLDAQRDISDVRDVARAYSALMASGQPGAVYNVSSGVGRTIRSVLDGLVARARVRVSVELDPSRVRPSDTPMLVGDPSRVRDVTGWQPTIPFEQTLDDLLDYWRRQEN